MLDSGKLILAGGCYNAYTAKIIEKAGFEAVYMSGGGTAGSFGLQDVGFQTLTEVTGNISHISDTIKVPFVCDADTGFGNAIHTTRAVKEYIRAGAAGMHIEDQTFYKRCGHLAGKMVISIEEAVGKYKAAADTRDEYDEDFLVIARCDARGAVGGGVDEVIKRSNAYAKAGADMIFPEAPASEEEVVRFVEEIDAPILYNWGGISPKFSVERMQELGIAITIFAGLAATATRRAVWDLAHDMVVRGPQAYKEYVDSMEGHPLQDGHAFIGVPEVQKMEDLYLPKEEIEQRLTADVGAQYKTGYKK
jgi:2-methylisocitrate lyase-like PEP mutase family enzyme